MIHVVRPIDVAPPALRTTAEIAGKAFTDDPTDERWEVYLAAMRAVLNHYDSLRRKNAAA